MAKITSGQKAALEAAGYTVKGNAVLNKSGGSVGGYNANGELWTGSAKVKGILKTPDKPAAKAPASVTTKAAAKAPDVAKDPMKGYRKGDVTTSKIPTTTAPKGGRGDGAMETFVRRNARALRKADEEIANKKSVPGGALVKAVTNGTNPKTEAEKVRRQKSGARKRLKSYGPT